MTSFFKISSLMVAVAFLCSSVQADSFDYSDVSGTNIAYSNIFETTNTDDPLFGAPSASGDNLDFPSTGFSANAVNEQVDFLNGTIDLVATANSGQTFNSVELNEFGVYFNSGDSAMSSVTTFIFVTVDGETFTDSITQTFEGTGSGAWNASFKIEVPDTDSAIIQFHNILLSSAGAGDVASISKRDVDLVLNADGNPVPEPTAAVVLMAGLMGTALRRRRS